jgi:hypothetical protein
MDCISRRLSFSNRLLSTCTGIHPWLSMPISISTSPAGRASFSAKPSIRGILVTMSPVTSAAANDAMWSTPRAFTTLTTSSPSTIGTM